ncbi:hypothetical protein EDD11_004973 [Mortierella claussenii]|nr:hypothetical protein EDD11_004973 [Mortierella claussenii]
MIGDLTLFCLIDGQPTSRTFEIDIPPTRTVARLRDLIKIKKAPAFDDIAADALLLWLIEIPKEKQDSVVTLGSLDKKEMLIDPRIQLSKLFPESPGDNTYILVQRPLQGLKRGHAQGGKVIPQLKRFKPNATVFKDIRRLVYYADQTESNELLVTKIRNGEFVRVYGSRASGKSSRIVDAMEILENDYECIYVDLQTINVSSEREFWLSLSQHFHGLEASSSLLSAIRAIRNDPSKGTKQPTHVIHSVVSIGTYAILQLNQTNLALSPFNANDNFQNIGLSVDQVRSLYHEFAEDRRITIEDEVIDDIFLACNGHAGLVNISGVAMDDSLVSLPDGEKVDMNHWRPVVNTLLSKVSGYGTFQRLIRDLTGQSDRQVSALAFYRSHFLGNTSEMTVRVYECQRHFAEYLAVLGVLYPESEDTFKIASPLMDSLIRQTVIPVAYPNSPNTRPPKRSDKSLDILEVIKSTLRYFDKDFIVGAHLLSYKVAPVRVDNQPSQLVPRESVYDSEMTRIFRNWLTRNGYHVMNQHHVENVYCDIMIQTETHSVVLELMVTDTVKQVQQNVMRTADYKNRTGANEGWLIHFTRQDDYLKNPYWPAGEILEGGIGIMHIWHDEEFIEVRLSAKWKNPDGLMILVEDERVI